MTGLSSRRFEAEEKTAGGILLPDSAKNKPQKGKVLAVGPGQLLKDGTPPPLAGQGRRHGPVHHLGRRRVQGAPAATNILLMREEDVLAVLDE